MKRLLLICLFLFVVINGYSQTLSSYSFCAFDSTYVNLPSSLSFLTPDYSYGGGGYYDDDTYNSIPIGFNFVYCGTTYTTLSASENCYIILGELMMTTEYPWSFDNDLDNLGGPLYGYSSYFNLPRPILAPLWTDVVAASANVRYNTVGATGSRVFTIEWYHASFYPSFTPFEDVEIKLYETSNWIDFRYNNLSSGSYSGGYCGIGITGGDGALSSSAVTGTQPYWSLDGSGSSPTASMTVNTRTITGQPATNQVYRWMIYSMTTTATNSGAVCSGGNVTLTGAVTGGTGVTYLWSGPGGYSSTLLSPTITGVTTTGAGTYTFTATSGCFSSVSSTIVTVNPLPASIIGTSSVCVGSTVTLSDGTTAGTWSSSSMGTATVSGTGVVTGVASGIVTISYTLGTGCYTTYPMTINITPSSITGTASLCAGSTTTLSDIISGGTWSSVTGGVATISGTGVVSGVSMGTSVISYTIGSCNATRTVTVNPDPMAITGASSVCVGSTVTLGETTIGGTWSSSATGTASVSGTGVVTGVSTGTVTISYTLGTGCYATYPMTVNITPSSITGTATLCAGATTTLSDITTGGTWSSVTGGVATISGTGVVSGVSAGTSVISYTIGSCPATRTVTVYPDPATITGTTSVCIGLTTTLGETTTGGTWSSGSTGIATVSGTGVVTGVAAGTATISYVLGTGCYATAIVTVNALPLAITGPDSVCVGASMTLADGTAGGSWTSAGTTIATIGSGTGVVTGVAAGTVIISYGAGCFRTLSLTVNPVPVAITGTTSLCLSESTTTLSDATSGGLWSSSSTGIATIISSGVVTGISIGTATITYKLVPTGCYATTVVTVNPLPAAITGADTVCVGSTTSLSDITSGGTWNSVFTAIATIGSATGVVTGVSSGTTTIIYTLASTGCFITFTENVRPLPAAITGITNVCATEGATTLSDITPGGTWTSGSTAIVTIGGSTGIITGVSSGSVTITYTLPTSCYVTQSFTVNPLPAAISGAGNICAGTTTTLTDVSTGGTWSSSNTAVATIGAATGIVTGVAAGSATITYTLSTGCYITFTETVHALPAAITGSTFVVCQGLSITLTDASSGGNWSSSNTSLANVGAGSGIVTGVSAGTPTISYILSSGCFSTAVVTVNPLPAAIGGPTAVCMGQTITATETSVGGSWASSNTAVATIGAGTGVITGITSGSATITYTLATGCIMTEIITVDPLPAAISGPVGVCVGSTITINDATGGGAWSSSNTTIATVSSVTVGTGAVNGIASGPATITYTIGTGCYVTELITVNPLPSAITGNLAVCELGGTSTLSDASPGGTWSSGNTAIATMGATTGVLTGIVPGFATISYTLTLTGCATTALATVHPLPVAIVGDSLVCVASSITVSGIASGGTWSVSPTIVASVGFSTGIITGISGGVATVTYTVANNCYITKSITVNALPPAVIIPLGATLMCPGEFVELLANTGAGLTYQWYDNGFAVSGSTATNLLVTATGAYSVFETNGAGCAAYATAINVIVDSPIAHIAPPVSDTFCTGTTLTLYANTGSGLSYQWSYNGVPVVGATGSSFGATIAGEYKVDVFYPAGCSASDSIKLYNKPSPTSTITAYGPLSFCVGDSVILMGSASTAYQWNFNGSAIPGATNIYYVAFNGGNYTLTETNNIGCNGTSATTVVTANPLPNTVIIASGPTTFCAGGNVVLGVSETAICTFQWYNLGTLIPGATNAIYIDTASGSFTVSVTNIATGCTAVTALPQDVIVVSFPKVIGLTPISFCWGSTATLAVDVFGGTGISYQWIWNGSVIPGATNDTLVTGTPGVYTCMLVVSGSCVVMASPLTLTEYPLPNPTITWMSPDLVTQNYYVTYQWYKNLVLVTGATGYYFNPLGNGNYTVKVTDTNGCQSMSDVYVLTNYTDTGKGVDTSGGGGDHHGGTYVKPVNNNGAGIKIFPNPASTTVYVESAMNLRAIAAVIDGRKIIDQPNVKEIDISNLANGTYMIMLYDDDGVMVMAEKLVKVGK